MPATSIQALASRALLALVFLSFVGASCGQSTLGLLPGVVNNPHNLSLRRSILKFGTSRICGELQKRSVPLKMHDEDPVLGRFFPTTCFAQELANENLLVQFGGFGFAWTNITNRLGFEAAGAVEYDADFLMDGSTMYVYFRQRSTSAATFTVKMMERPDPGAVIGLPIGIKTGTSSIGAQILRDQITRGFTVIRSSDGDVEFGLGIVERGQHPTAPYRLDANGGTVIANERSEVHQNQRDFVGPIEITRGTKMSLRLAVDGAPAIDVLLVPKYVADTWLQAYTTQPQATAPPGAALLDETVTAGIPWRRSLEPPAGTYYLVLDNTATAGRAAPTGFAHDDRAALVSYAIDLDD